MIYGQVGCQINLEDLMDHIGDKIDKQAKLAMDAEITEQFMTIQKEIEGVCKQYLKELFDDTVRK